MTGDDMKNGDKRIRLTAEETALMRELNDTDDYGEPSEFNDTDSQLMVYEMLAEKYSIDLDKNFLGFTEDYKVMLIVKKVNIATGHIDPF
jgi:hypothetical protein